MANEPTEVDRRLFLAGTGFAMATPLLAASTPASAHQPLAPEDSVFGKTGNFDLDDPADRLLARIKVNASLTGEKVYLWNMSRHMFCEPGKPPYMILAELEMMTIWIMRGEDPDGPAGKIGALFTRIPVDPMTFEEITSFDHPYLGKTMPAEHFQFGGSGFPVDPADPKPNIVFQQHRPHYRMGENICIVNFDPDMEYGEFHPKVDTAILTANYADMMDPATGQVDCDWSFSAQFPADRYSWAGLERGDPAQIHSLKVGRKVGRLEDVPPEFQRTIIAQYPERM